MMTKNKWISAAIIAAVVIGMIVMIKYTPIWVLLTNAAFFAAGWFARKYFFKDAFLKVEKVESSSKKKTSKK